MAWDRRAGGFNYYRSTGPTRCGCSRATRATRCATASRGKGPFESHPSGALLMKELKTPWINWHSPTANIPATAFAKNDPRRRHAWFTKRDRAERSRSSSTRRGRRSAAGPGRASPPAQAGRHRRPAAADHGADPRHADGQPDHDPHREPGARARQQLDLPATFFVDSEGLSDVLGLAPAAVLHRQGEDLREVPGEVRRPAGGRPGFVRKGDTHFCFLVPERAFEDQVVLREAIGIGLVSRRLAACLLMVDPWNPVFSDRRRALLRHVPGDGADRERQEQLLRATWRGRSSRPPRPRRAAPEAEFAKRWAVGRGLPRRVQPDPQPLLRQREARLKTQAGFDAYFKLAEERRQEFKAKMPIAEFPLLLPQTNIRARGRRCNATAPWRRADRAQARRLQHARPGSPTRTRPPGASASAGCSRHTSTAACRSSTTRRRRTRPPARRSRWSPGSRSPPPCATTPSQLERWKLGGPQP